MPPHLRQLLSECGHRYQGKTAFDHPSLLRRSLRPYRALPAGLGLKTAATAKDHASGCAGFCSSHQYCHAGENIACWIARTPELLQMNGRKLHLGGSE